MAFIVFEGLDACGKSTQITQLHHELNRLKQNNLILRDPGTTELGEKIRPLLLGTQGEAPVPRAETLLYQAARVQMVEKNIRPALESGQWVLCDRFYSSTVAFQSFARGLDLKDIENLNHFVAHDCEPDLFIFLDISTEESQRRKELRAQNTGVAQDRMEKESQLFQERVRQGYLYQAQKNPQRWLVLNGNDKPEMILSQILSEIRRRNWLL